MKRYGGYAWFLAVLFCVLVCGCSSVSLLQPLPRSDDVAERSRFDGEWIAGEGVIFIRFGSDGIGRFAGVDWKDERFVLDEGEAGISKGKHNTFLSVRMKEKGVWEERYYFVQYRFTDQGDLLLWLPDPAAFKQAITQGRLDGVVEKGKSGSVTLTSSPEKVLAFLDDPANGLLFEYRDPMVFKRLLLKPHDCSQP